MLLSAVIVLLLAAEHATVKAAYVTCERKYKKIGCFAESSSVTEEILINDRDKSSQHHQVGHFLSWPEFSQSIHSLACRCYEKAKKLGFTYFGIRYWGICVAGRDDRALTKMLSTGEGKSNNCANIKFQTCVNHEGGTECAGRGGAEYLYSVTAKSDPDIDGGYNDWSPWSKCTLTCGHGIIIRERVCGNPMPLGNGKDCTEIGPSTETKPCKLADCPIDGGYTAWTQFDECSVSCGAGVTLRNRFCTNPRPEHGGKACVGPASDSKQCEKPSCPVNGGFSDWSAPSKCSATCGSGVIIQTRTCTNPAPSNGGKDCVGEFEKTTLCATMPCPVDGAYSPWSSYSACSETCGDATKTRNRTCNNPAPAFGGKDCVGEHVQTATCKVIECPVHGDWGSWGKLSSCSATCGDGAQTRKRSCDNPAPKFNGSPCVGANVESKPCKEKECAVDGFYGPWSTYSECSVTCGAGEKARTRNCSNPAPANGGRDCSRLGSDKEVVTCKVAECPIDGRFTNWSNFSSCSHTCGSGTQVRTRSCTDPQPQHNGNECIGPVVDEQECQIVGCAVDGDWSEWSTFKSCSATCGDGTQTRTRSCNNPEPKFGGQSCVGPATEEKGCKLKECPVHGGWSNYSPYSKCSKTCGEGDQQRTRSCTAPAPKFGGDDCIGEAVESRTCKVKECPIDGGISQWSAFSSCSENCGDGIQKRTRTCTNPEPQYGGKECTESLSETQGCKERECPVDGGLTEWSTFGACSKTCGDGIEERTRSCTNPAPAHGGQECIGDILETRACKIKECPVNGGLSKWSKFSECMQTCGDSFQTRERECNNPEPAHGGKDCAGDLFESKFCKVKECPVNGGFTSWSSYGECSKTCGIGMQERTRTCTNPDPAHGGTDCVGEALQMKTCKVKECPVDGAFTEWGAFGECSKTCGNGVEEQTRTCTNPSPAHGGKDCEGSYKNTQACKLKECPVDGGLSKWSDFSTCSALCGDGTQERIRTCTNPKPAHGGDDCVGDLKEVEECKLRECPVDGGYSEWSDFSSCSETCGDGMQMRNRSCVNPPPAHGGKACSGDAEETKACKIRECPVNGGFSKWSSFGECSETCGSGIQERTRTCTNPKPAHEGDDCVGDLTDTKSCKLKECPVDGGFTEWSSFSACSELCGLGVKVRTRTCTNPTPVHGGKSCSGPTEDHSDCKVKECPIDGKYNPWSSFNACSKTCGDGTQTRTRTCDGPYHGGMACVGSPSQSVPCKIRECPVDGGFTSWSKYSTCSEECGTGEQERTRTCTNPAPAHGGKDCSGDDSQTKSCKIKECPVDGGFSPWSEFSRCSKDCGDGNKSRTRTCTNPAPAHGGKSCSGPTTNVDSCKVKECPVNGGYSPWSSFSECSKTCGDGTEVRTRSCTNPAPAHGGKGCSGEAKESQPCKDRECPIDGGFTQWSKYDECSELCGGGEQERTRSCANPKPAHGGKDCSGAISQTRACNTQKCVVDGGYGQWSKFDACSKTCGEGIQSRRRKCVNTRLDCSGRTVNTRKCKVKECPVNGGLTPWTSFTACSKTCGDGTQTRSRSCTNPAPAHGGKGCSGTLKESRSCKEKECPVDGGFTNWSSYSECSETCGDGTQVRTRTCANPAPAHGGKSCSGSLTSSMACKVKECPVNGKWGSWSSYGDCSKTCGMGLQQRLRKCNKPAPAHGGKDCSGGSTSIKVCNTRPCPVDGEWGSWGSYADCSKTCGSGLQQRLRKCNKPAPAHGGKDCPGGTTSIKVCNSNPCPVDGGFSQWSNYGACSETCGAGTQTRTRTCTNPIPAHGGKKCGGTTISTRSCKVKECPVNGGYTKWSSFSACSKTCGVGQQKRTRACTKPAPAHGGKKCSDSPTHVRNCKVRECAVNGNWGGWGAYGGCTKTCGGGVQSRFRSCNTPAPAHGGKGCTGSNAYVRVCNTKPCPVDGKFSSWSKFGACSKTCGPGIQTRTRTCTSPAPAHGGKGCSGSPTYSKACLLRHCPVNGVWGKWGIYGGCTKKCGGGVQVRYRSCNNPAPKYGGKTCPGSNKYIKVCNTNPCPVNGGWSNWSSYGKCSKSCGVGISQRTRSCNNPSPAHGGATCPGSASEGKSCIDKPCPVDGGWGAWSTYGFCTKSCGFGEQQRMRFCVMPAPNHGGKYCVGSMIETRKCNYRECPINGGFSSWSSYGPCSKPCGVGNQARSRSCSNPKPAHGGSGCNGPTSHSRTCKVKDCPVNGQWGPFGSYGPCNKKCGGGAQERYRSCNNPVPAHGGSKCTGSNKFVRVCNTHKCAVDGGFGTWSSYNACSRTCGTGFQTRTRACNHPAPAHGGKGCSGSTSETKNCHVRHCPINGNWGRFGNFGPCNKKCGGGAQERFRACNNPAPAHGGKACYGGNRGVRVCNTTPCPVDGHWGSFGNYGACNKPCGGGVQTRYRSCKNPAPRFGGKTCPGSNSLVRVCNTHACPVNGNWGTWGAFGSCNKHCGGGVQERYRPCNKPAPAHGGNSCPGSNRFIRACNTHSCPVNGGFTAWSSFGACSKSCGVGSQIRSRSCTNPRPAYGGRGCYGHTSESRTCKIRDCAVHGNWGNWGYYGSCNAHCNGGVQERYRYCNSPAPAHGGRGCAGSNRMVKACNTHKCPINGNWGHWGRYGACSVPCNGGVMERYRSCNNPAPAHRGRACPGSSRMVHACNTHKCAVNGNWGSWGAYGACSAKCGGGVAERFRSCNKPAPAYGGKGCYGSSKMVKACNTQACSGWSGWGSWGACTLPCNGGIRFRFRNCNSWPCPGSQNMVGVCNLHRCTG